MLPQALDTLLLLPVTPRCDLFNHPGSLWGRGSLQVSLCQTHSDSPEGPPCLVHNGHLVWVCGT